MTPAAAVAPAVAVVAPEDAAASPEVFYPPWDGRLMGETPKHYRVIAQTHFTLESWFRPRGDVYVAANTFVYYRRGEPRVNVVPDLLLVRGTHVRERRIWQTWKEGGRGPQFVLEVASRSTRRADRCVKPAIYRTIGVEEYFQFDPELESDPVLRGLRLVDGEYEPVAPGGKWSGLRSEVLGLDLCLVDDTLRFRDPKTGELLLTADEERAGRLEEKAGRLKAEAEKLEAEARVRELEARLRSRSDPDSDT